MLNYEQFEWLLQKNRPTVLLTQNILYLCGFEDIDKYKNVYLAAEETGVTMCFGLNTHFRIREFNCQAWRILHRVKNPEKSNSENRTMKTIRSQKA